MFLLFLFIYRLILFAIESDFYIRIQTGFERDAILGDAARLQDAPCIVTSNS